MPISMKKRDNFTKSVLWWRTPASPTRSSAIAQLWWYDVLQKHCGDYIDDRLPQLGDYPLMIVVGS